MLENNIFGRCEILVQKADYMWQGMQTRYMWSDFWPPIAVNNDPGLTD